MEYLTIEEIKQLFEYLDEEDFESVSKILDDSSFNMNIDEMTDEQEEEFVKKFNGLIASRINPKDYDDLLKDEEIDKYYLEDVIIATNNSELMKKCIENKKEQWNIDSIVNLIISTKDKEFMYGILANSNQYNITNYGQYYAKKILLATQGEKFDFDKHENIDIVDLIVQTGNIELIEKIAKGNNDFEKFKLIVATKDPKFIKKCIEDSNYEWTDRELKQLIIAVNEPNYIIEWLEDKKSNNKRFNMNDEAELIAATNEESYIKNVLKEKSRLNKVEILKFTGKKKLIEECIRNKEVYGIDEYYIPDLVIATNDENFIKDILKDDKELNRTKILKRLNNKSLVKELIDDETFNWSNYEAKVLIILTKDPDYIKEKIQREKQDTQEKKYGFNVHDIADLTIATADKDLMKKFASQQCQDFSLHESEITELFEAIDDDEFTKKILKSNKHLNRTDILKQLDRGNLTKEIIEDKEFEWSKYEMESLLFSTRDKEFILKFIVDNKYPDAPHVSDIIDEISDEKKYDTFNKFKEAGLKNYIFQYRQSKGIEYLRNNIDQIMKIEGVDKKDIPYRKECLMKMYEVNNEVLEKIDFSILEPHYIELLGLDKLNQISCYPNIQQQVLNLNNSQLQVFSKCIDNNKATRWTPLAQSILKNISEYGELIENLTLSEKVDFEKINIIIQDKNIFNIQTIDDVNNYEQIRRDKCDEWIKSNDIQQKKLAVLEKIYGQSLEYSEILIKKYGKDIESIQECDLREYVQSIKAILSVEDPAILEDIYDKCKEVENVDKISIEETLKSEYGKLYNEGLFSTEQADKIEEGVYEAGTDFKILLTSLSAFADAGRRINNYREDWNRPAIAAQHFCASYIRNDMMGTAPIHNICYRIF